MDEARQSVAEHSLNICQQASRWAGFRGEREEEGRKAGEEDIRQASLRQEDGSCVQEGPRPAPLRPHLLPAAGPRQWGGGLQHTLLHHRQYTGAVQVL